MRALAPALFVAGLATLAVAPAAAITRGEVARNPNGLRQSVVRVESSRGELCSGALIGPDLILTAAHCVDERATYRVIVVDRNFRQRTVKAIAAAMHPAFVPGTTPRTQPGVDLAILKLEQPLGADFVALDPRYAGRAGRGEPVQIAGFGVEAEASKGSARVLRQTRVVSLGTLQVANRVDVVVDGERLARVPGAGACRGDSGGPIVRGGPGGYQLVGIVSWSSGAMKSRRRTACGGLTAVTPVADHANWIAARAADLRRMQPGQPAPRTAATNPYDWRFQ
jgi:secreted trypsin-like serine protease